MANKVNSEIKIEKGIPLPMDGRGVHGRYAWDAMKVGDSFLFPTDLNNPQSAHNISKYAGLKRGWKFTARKTPEGYRCWRVA